LNCTDSVCSLQLKRRFSPKTITAFQNFLSSRRAQSSYDPAGAIAPNGLVEETAEL
jgi:hypothetical protein